MIMAKKAAKQKLTSEGLAKKLTLRIDANEVKHYDEVKKIFGKKQYSDAILLAVKNVPSYIHEINLLKSELLHIKGLLQYLINCNTIKVNADKRLIEAIERCEKNFKYDPKKHNKQTSILDTDDNF